MANRTDSSAISVHGTNPQYLVEKIVRLKIHESTYWKEHCYALTAETLVDKAVELEYIGGTYGGYRKPAPFICLVLKMLQLQPELEIVFEFITNKDYKYVSALGCLYLRLVGKPEDIYSYLEPLYNDYRKLRYRETDGKYKLIHVDEFIDELLFKDVLCDTTLPRIPKRQILEDAGKLQMRHSVLEDVDDDDEALLAEIREDGANGGPKELLAGEDELVENPRARGLKDESAERSPKSEDGEKRDDEEERRRRKEKKRQKKEKKKSKYRTRGSISRSNSRNRDRSEGSKSRSRSRSRSEKKKKKSSKWKKNLKEKRRDRREGSRSRSRSDSRSRSGDRSKHKKDKEKRDDKDNKNNKNKAGTEPDENSDEYWLKLRAQFL